VIADHSPTRSQRQQVNALLGREARGLRSVAVAGEAGQPRVIEVASLVEDKPFPTLFWLVDPELSYRIDRLEADGLIAVLQSRIDGSDALRESMVEDHLAHIRLRNQLMPESERARLQALGFFESLQERGIGGIENFTRIRCLHTWYAAHLVVPNTVGRLLDEYWASVEAEEESER
jgi:hypothetical protein